MTDHISEHNTFSTPTVAINYAYRKLIGTSQFPTNFIERIMKPEGLKVPEGLFAKLDDFECIDAEVLKDDPYADNGVYFFEKETKYPLNDRLLFSPNVHEMKDRRSDDFIEFDRKGDRIVARRRVHDVEKVAMMFRGTINKIACQTVDKITADYVEKVFLEQNIPCFERLVKMVLESLHIACTDSAAKPTAVFMKMLQGVMRNCRVTYEKVLFDVIGADLVQTIQSLPDITEKIAATEAMRITAKDGGVEANQESLEISDRFLKKFSNTVHFALTIILMPATPVELTDAGFLKPLGEPVFSKENVAQLQDIITSGFTALMSTNEAGQVIGLKAAKDLLTVVIIRNQRFMKTLAKDILQAVPCNASPLISCIKKDVQDLLAAASGNRRG